MWKDTTDGVVEGICIKFIHVDFIDDLSRGEILYKDLSSINRILSFRDEDSFVVSFYVNG
jgi:hypothetical protein